MCALPATPTPVLLGSVSGTVWLDMNANGTRNPGEGGMADVTVSLRAGGCGGSVVATTTTASNGSYSFADLSAGNYCVSVSLSCDLCGGWCASPGSSNPRSLSLAGGEHKTGVDFGFYLQGPC